MASGLQGGVNKPNDMIPRDGSSLQYGLPVANSDP